MDAIFNSVSVAATYREKLAEQDHFLLFRRSDRSPGTGEKSTWHRGTV